MPTLHLSEILRNTLIRIQVAQDAHEQGKLDKVRLSNYTTQSYGRNYYRIDLAVDFNVAYAFHFPDFFGKETMPPEPLTDEQKASNDLQDRLRYIPDYVSFNQDHDTEKEVEVHYEWISALLNFYLGRQGVPLEIAYFETESSRQYRFEREREQPQRDQEQQEFLATYSFLGDVGDFAVVEDYLQSARLIRLDREQVHSTSPYAGLEVKADLTPGKRRLDHIGKSRLIAVFTPEQLAEIHQSHPFTKTKTGLLQVLTESRTGLPLKYSRPEAPKSSAKSRKANRTAQ